MPAAIIRRSTARGVGSRGSFLMNEFRPTKTGWRVSPIMVISPLAAVTRYELTVAFIGRMLRPRPKRSAYECLCSYALPRAVSARPFNILSAQRLFENGGDG